MKSSQRLTFISLFLMKKQINKGQSKNIMQVNMKKYYCLGAFLLFVLICPSLVVAAQQRLPQFEVQSPDSPSIYVEGPPMVLQGQPPSTISAGPGFIFSNSLYRGADDNVFIAIPMVYYRTPDFEVRGNQLSLRLFGNEDIEFRAIGSWRFDGYKESDSPFLAGMNKRKRSVDVGGQMTVKHGSSNISLSFLTDLLNNHEGNEARLTYSLSFRRERTIISPSISLIYRSQNLIDYYYGVRATEAIANRPFYNPSNAYSVSAGLSLVHPISDRWTFNGIFAYEHLPNEIRNSPIVDVDHRFTAITGLVYGF